MKKVIGCLFVIVLAAVIGFAAPKAGSLSADPQPQCEPGNPYCSGLQEDPQPQCEPGNPYCAKQQNPR